MGMAIATVLKQLGYCETTKEVKTALNSTEMLVNNKRVKDHKHIIGLMDVLAVPSKGLYFRMIIDNKGKLFMIAIPKKEAALLPCRVNSITMVKGAKLQLNCHNGYNILIEKKTIAVNDTVVLNLENKKIEQHLPLKEGATVLVTGGKLAGTIAKLVKREGRVCTLKLDDATHTTLLKYVFVVGDTTPVVKLR